MNTTLQKKAIKKANNMSTSTEDMILVNEFMEKIVSNATSESMKPESIATLPLVKCRDMMPDYLAAFHNLEKVFAEFELTYSEDGFDLFYQSLKEFDEIQINFTEALIDFGDFIPSFTYEEFPKTFMLSHDDYVSNKFIENCRFSINILSLVEKELVVALEEANKSKCMALAPIITGCSYNIFHSAEIQKESLEKD